MTKITDFTNLYPVSKTLRWALKPIGKTEYYINEAKIIESDKNKADAYEQAKSLLDEVYKDFINETLSDFAKDNANYSADDYRALAKALDAFNQDKAANRDALYSALAQCRNKIVKHMKEHKEFGSFAGSGKAKEVLAHAYAKDETGNLKEMFNNFAGYFNGYCENRGNLFSNEAKASAIAYRLVDENFPKFYRNQKTLNNIREKYPELFSQIENQLRTEFDVENVVAYFSVENYANFMVQKGIDAYNTFIGGKTIDTAEKKVQGINELVNLYCQIHPDVRKRELLFVPLYKQLLEDKNKMSFIPKQCQSDNELVETIVSTKEFIPRITKILEQVKDYQSYYSDQIYVSNKQVPALSILMFGSGRWNTFFDYMIEEKKNELLADSKKGTVTKQQQKIIDAIAKQEFYPIKKLEQIYDSHKDINAKSFYTVLKEDINGRIADIGKTCHVLEGHVPEDVRSNAVYVSEVKNYLDSILESASLIKAFIPSSDYEGDSVFYESFEGFEDIVRQIVRVYDFTRNYMTKEVSPEEKFKLNFNCSTLANGWDRNKEHDNLCTILKADGKFYLAIKNKVVEGSIDINAENCPIISSELTYEKMIYKYLPSPSKMLPKVFFSRSGRMLPYGPSPALIRAYDDKKNGNAKYFEKDFGTERNYVIELIKFYMNAIPQYGDWIEFGMAFKPAEEYESLNEFYQDMEKQNFFIRFERISKHIVDELVDSGKLFLFQIYSKDFSEQSFGKKNLHTMYWEYMFSDENIDNTKTIKLNGEAELFYRPAIKHNNTVTHPVGSYLVNRNTANGKHIPDKVYKEIYEFANGKLDTLSTDAEKWYKLATIKRADRNLTKGERFTHDQFSFHVPITINYNAEGNTNINAAVCQMLIENPDCNIIGIDRGERNLLYISVINQNGEIIYQKSLNSVPGSKGIEVDYISKLEDAEISRDEARKSWNTIGKIADLKEGYLSSVVSLIKDLIVKYNAIVVLEDLNKGFKRGRFKVERQVYQKFESALITKLGLVVSKDAAFGEPMSIPCALQLTDKFVSFEKMEKQTGCLFYVPAAYTSKIDPTTGFANLFNLKDLTNFEKKVDFIRKFSGIRYNEESDEFLFEFNYSNFNCLVKQTCSKNWVISSRGERIIRNKDNSVHKEIPTNKIKSILDSASLPYRNEDNLVSMLSSLPKNNENIKLIDEFYRSIGTILQMRNSNSQTGEDYIISPVKGTEGYYDSRNYTEDSALPCDADANGAYNIARKGLVMINKIKASPEDSFNATRISNEEWFGFVTGV